ncbi:unnamed protein product [Parnassius apollo]|uniref:(apollo) hypothetical protein n=1 Tax=Parnassius apollo TaxID=110799 RepID=A0A8S3W6Z7_PARAO|nr:unnamed protein product [Parnassius apollo]
MVSWRNVSPEVVVVVERLGEKNGNKYLLVDQHELYQEEVVTSSSDGAVRGARFPATAAAGGRQARGARGARVSASSSWRRGDHLVEVCA